MGTALVLEDDVDMEWDINRIWPTILRRLPKGNGPEPAWQQVYLGHCAFGVVRAGLISQAGAAS